VRPDLTIVLNVSADVAEHRRRVRAQARELFEVPELQRRLADTYAQAHRLVPEDHVVHVDGEAPLEAVATRVLTAFHALEKRSG
jgi:thymidylate kinase